MTEHIDGFSVLPAMGYQQLKNTARLSRLFFPGLLGFALATIPGCNTMPSQVGPMIAKRLPAMLGPADNYTCTVNGNIFEAMRGKIRSVHIHGDNVALSPLMHVHSFDADAVNIHVDTRNDTVQSIGQVRFNIAMSQDDINNYMASAKPDDTKRGAALTLGTSLLTYSDSVGMWALRTSFAVAGTLSPRAGHPNQMDFNPDNAQLAKLPVPIRLVQVAVDHQNPVVDLSQMKYPVAIKSAVVDHGQLKIEGTTDMSAVLAAASSATSAAQAHPSQ